MINKILGKLKTKDGKTILENFLSLSSLQIVGMLLPLITLPYILRIIGFEKYGILVFASSLILYFQSLTDFSFKITATRDVAIFKNSPQKLNIIYSKVLIIKFIFLFLSWLIIFLLVSFYKPFYEYWEIYLFTSLLLFGYVLFPEWFFQGIEKMKYITFLNIGVKLFFTLCVFVFIKNENDFWIYPLLQSLGFIGAGLIGQYMIVKKYKLKFVWISFRSIKQTIKSNTPIFINQFLPTLYNNTSTFILGLISSKELVGIYQAILTIINLANTLLDIISRVFFPYLTRKKNAFNSFLTLMSVVVCVIALLILIFNQIIFYYLDLNYENAILVLLILTIGIFGYTYSVVFGLNYFIVRRMDKLVMRNTIIASFLGLILAYPLIKYFSIVGAAINLTLARSIMGGGLFYQYIKNKKKLNV